MPFQPGDQNSAHTKSSCLSAPVAWGRCERPAIRAWTASSRRRFPMPETRATATLNHPHIATLYDVGPDYLVMEFVEGETLAGPCLWLARCCTPGRSLGALDAAHRKSSVHRDLKPRTLWCRRVPHDKQFISGRVARLSASPDTAEL